ncbi:unnamed protein product [Parnassius apollo]|uniref:(apollo) hypothetical protein n=1 Tax=Parnassius apollo TaxID=110799 RepID=A0A8S3WLZ4_PARAO|nr:unnamed protein product [Parnassius apollo]
MVYWAKMKRLAMTAAMQLNVFVSHIPMTRTPFILGVITTPILKAPILKYRVVTWTMYQALDMPDQPSTSQADILPRDQRQYCYTASVAIFALIIRNEQILLIFALSVRSQSALLVPKRYVKNV